MFCILRDTSCCHDCYKWWCLFVEVNVICDMTRKEISNWCEKCIIITLTPFALLSIKMTKNTFLKYWHTCYIYISFISWHHCSFAYLEFFCNVMIFTNYPAMCLCFLCSIGWNSYHFETVVHQKSSMKLFGSVFCTVRF